MLELERSLKFCTFFHTFREIIVKPYAVVPHGNSRLSATTSLAGPLESAAIATKLNAPPMCIIIIYEYLS